ncbi:MAG: YgiQ family radical SAM protein [archaeon]
MVYDIIFVTGEAFFDSPLCGAAILKRLLEKHNLSVGIIEMPRKEADVAKLGKPRLFFGVSAGSIDSLVRNYTPLKKLREEDKNLSYDKQVPDRAVIVYSNWVRHLFPDAVIVLGGTEASLRRFVHYDYWQNRLRKPVLFDSRADILAYGSAEKQVLEIAGRIRAGEPLLGIAGTCVVGRTPAGLQLPSFDEVSRSKESFCDMQNMLTNEADLCQKIDNRYAVQFRSPQYTTADLDSYYELPFSRKAGKRLSGFEFSVVTHRGCIGNCSFCSLTLTQGRRIVSRSEGSIIREIRTISGMPHFRGVIDDLGGPAANMYGMDCNLCNKSCLDCRKLDRSNRRVIELLKKARAIKGVKNVFIRSGIRYDLVSDEYLGELTRHVSGRLKIAPEHVNRNVLKLMNKDFGNLKNFMRKFKKTGKELSFYFMTAHPGSGMKEAKELADAIRSLKNAEAVQVFTPTPMTVSTCMYYTGLDPSTKEKVYVPYTYREKKEQKRLVTG